MKTKEHYPKSILLLLLLGSFIFVKAQDLERATPITNSIVMLHFDEGFVIHHKLGDKRENETLVHTPLNVGSATNLSSYSIISTDDPNYSSGKPPIDLSQKSKGTNFAWLCENYVDPVGCNNTSPDHAKEHDIYLFLPNAMVNGRTYTIETGNLAANRSAITFTYNDRSSRSEAVHVNNIGYDPTANAKYGYVYHWMGTKGGVDLSSYNGANWQLINQADGSTVFSGTLRLRKPESNSEETPYKDDTPNGNFLGAEVYEAEFSGYGGTGTYVLSVDGIGTSFPFEINSNVYDDPFYWTMKGLYMNRSGIALTAPYTDQPRPADHNVNTTPGFAGRLKYTSTRLYDVSNADYKAVDKPLWEAGLKGDINTWGWYHDAGDWDAYPTHSRVPANLLFLYEAAPGNFGDNELNIPESGNGIPDVLDEARWLIRYYHRTRKAIKDAGYGTGGVGGARTMGNPYGEDYEEDGTTVGSWGDTYRDWIVSGEDPHMTYTYAGLAAQFAYILEQRGLSDPEGIDWRQEAVESYNWAKNNTRPGDEVVKFQNDLDLLASRMYAATALYRLTGTAEYNDQFKADVVSKGINTSTILEKDNLYSAWIYSLTNNRTKDEATASLVRSAVVYTADIIMTSNVDKRATRWSGNWYFPMLIGQPTTPMINEGIMAWAIIKDTDPQKALVYKLFAQTTCDYFLGTNPLNMTWITGVGDRSPKEIFHLDSWYNGTGEIRKGLIPYGVPTETLELGPVGPWNPRFANPTLTPSINDWPGHERWFDLRSAPLSTEFTVHQTNGVAAMAYGFLKNGPGTPPGPDDNNNTDDLVYDQNNDADGLVNMQAEKFSSVSSGTGSFAQLNWSEQSDTNADEGKYMKVVSTGNNAFSTLEGPSLNYEINFVKTGAHYLWMRFRASDVGNDSCIPVLDGVSQGEWNLGEAQDWVWRKVKLQDISPGQRTFSIYMREDGLDIDQLILTSNNDYNPEETANESISFQQSDDSIGLVTMEAEAFTTKNFGTGNFSALQWTALSDANTCNGQYMEVVATGNNAFSALEGPSLEYEINFVKTGAHYLWMRFRAKTTGDDSCIPVLDGTSQGEWNTGPAEDWVWRRFQMQRYYAGHQNVQYVYERRRS